MRNQDLDLQRQRGDCSFYRYILHHTCGQIMDIIPVLFHVFKQDCDLCKHLVSFHIRFSEILF